MLEKIREDGMMYYQVKTEFDAKTMVGDLMMMERSGMPRKMKIASLTQEIIRRNRNQTGEAPESICKEHLSRFMLKLKLSGYKEKERLQILLAGQRGYNRMVTTEKIGGRPINRPDSMGKRKRRLHNT